MEIAITSFNFDDDCFPALERDPLEIIDVPRDGLYTIPNSSIPAPFFNSNISINNVPLAPLDGIEDDQNNDDDQNNQMESPQQDDNVLYLKCIVCEAMFFNFLTFKGHLLSCHMSKTEDGYACSFCEYTHIEVGNLLDHLLSHKNQCELCHCDLSKDNNFYVHWSKGMTDLVILRDIQGAFVCALCELSFDALSNLEKHWFKHTCRDYRTIQCKDCSKNYKENDTHFCFCCAGCKETFDSFHQLRIHAVYHKHTLQCPICNYDFVLRRDHNHHMTLHRQIFYSIPDTVHCLESCDGKIFQCDICAKIFSSLSYLSKHLKLKHPIKP